MRTQSTFRTIFGILCLIAISLASSAQPDSVKVKNYLNSIQDKESLLNQFFMYMPKGGDIHNHLTGSAYAETYFTLSTKDKLWINMDNGKLYPTKEKALQDNVASPFQLSENMPNLHSIRMKLIDLWSVRNFDPAKAKQAPDEYFFGTFGLFSAVTSPHMVDLLKELKNRAARENVQYLEIMATSPVVDTTKLKDYHNRYGRLGDVIVNKSQILTDTLSAIFKEWENDPYMKGQITSYIKLIDSIDSHSNIPDEPFAPMCLYQAYASRNSDPLSVYAQLYISFKACADQRNHKIVGVNIVAAENGEKSMLYYSGHMKMFDFLKKAVPNVKTSLHAGEMTIGLVKPEDLGSHIREAVYTAKANRIGHGIDIGFENGSISLLNELKNRNIPIEINLVSNEFILGVKNNDHPFPLYLEAGVPLVISTDDPGILRTNLAEQYTLLESRYHVDYFEIKQLVRNSIRYSFATETTKTQLLSAVDKKFGEFEHLWVENIAIMSSWTAK
jgi:adenosine deaminase